MMLMMMMMIIIIVNMIIIVLTVSKYCYALIHQRSDLVHGLPLPGHALRGLRGPAQGRHGRDLGMRLEGLRTS